MAVTVAGPLIIPEVSVVTAVPSFVVSEGGNTLPREVTNSTLVPLTTLLP